MVDTNKLRNICQSLRSDRQGSAGHKWAQLICDAADEIDELRLEEELAQHTVFRQRETLTDVANALKGKPDPDTGHSHHDLGIVARKRMTEIDRLREQVEQG